MLWNKVSAQKRTDEFPYIDSWLDLCENIPPWLQVCALGDRARPTRFVVEGTQDKGNHLRTIGEEGHPRHASPSPTTTGHEQPLSQKPHRTLKHQVQEGLLAAPHLLLPDQVCGSSR